MTLAEFALRPESAIPHFLVIGDPIAHSLSPLMHGVALTHHRREERYHALHVPSADLRRFMEWFRGSTTLGINVTLPHKKAIIPLLDTLSRDADASGAVNTVVRRGDTLHGELTDLHGIRTVLSPFTRAILGEGVVILGSGGAANAAARVALDMGAVDITIVSRKADPSVATPDPNSAATLDPTPAAANGQSPGAPGPVETEDVGAPRAGESSVRVIGYADLPSALKSATLVIQATPMGMKGGGMEAESPIPASLNHLLAGKIGFDMVYTPLVTPFLKQVGAHGGTPLQGLEMLIHQGDAAFHMWTGLHFPLDDVRAALHTVLAQ